MAALLGVVALLCAGARAGRAAPAIASEFPLRLLRVERRFPGAFVKAVAQTPDGFLWIATNGGLRRFDGVSFTGADGRNGSSDAIVPAAYVDRQGVLWVGGLDGVHGNDPRSAVWAPAPGAVVDLGEDESGRLWAITPRGLFVRRGRAFAQVDGPAHPQDSRFWRTPGGGLWLECDEGWWQQEGEGWVRRAPLLGYGHRHERVAFLLDHFVPAAQREAARPFEAELGARYLETLLLDRHGRLFIGTTNGLFMIEGGRREVIGAREGLPDSHVRRLFEDAEGSLWVVTHGGGLAQVWAPAVGAVTALEGLAGNTPFAVATAPDGALWTTTVAGLSRIADGRLQNLVSPAGFPAGSVRSMAFDPRGRLWLTTLTADLLSYDPADGTFARHALPRAISGEMVNALICDEAGRLVFATNTGRLLRGTDPARAEELRGPQPGCEVTAAEHPRCAVAVISMARRRAGGVWLGLEGGAVGLLEADGRLAPPLASRWTGSTTIWSLAEDQDGVLWGGGERGLFALFEGRVIGLNEAAGLHDEPIFGVTVDRSGQLWLAGLHGIRRLSRPDPARPNLPAPSAVFTTADGLPSDMPMGNTDPTIAETPDGRVWFVMITGLAVAMAPGEATRPPVPPVHVDRLEVDRRSVPFGPGLPLPELPPGFGDVEVQYTAPSFVAPGHLRFRYRLQGLKEPWVDAGARRFAHYTNLPPGDYLFEVQALWDDRPGGVRSAVVPFRLRPHFYQTTLFKGMLVLGALALVAGLFILRSRQLRARFAAVLEERQRIARDLHDGLGQIFAALGFQIDSMQRQSPEDLAGTRAGLAQLRRILAHGRRLTRGVIGNLRAVRPRTEGLVMGVQELAGLFEGARISVAVEGAPRVLGLEVETELLHVAQQALSNAIEHGGARHVGITLDYASPAFALWIRDDGEGFEPPPPDATSAGEHYGLASLRERATKAGGKLVVESAPGVGTEVGIVLAPRR